MSYRDRNPFVINYIGVSTAWGAIGEWIIEGILLSQFLCYLIFPKLYIIMRLRDHSIIKYHECLY